MITKDDIRDIEKIGNFGTETAFSIKNTAKAFKILIGNLYPNKPKAVLKELSSNAVDAHIAAGKADRPFDVWLPSTFEPNFIVRDYGISMSHEFMLQEYTTAFYSSKDKTNQFVGALGIGRLSALALCDAYIATTFKDGVKRTYSVYANEEGIPTIVSLTEESTDEEDGFCVEIPVDPSLVNEFEAWAKNIYTYYKVRPNIKNRNDFKFEELSYVVEATDKSWGLRGSGSGAVAIMGCYSYPIDINLVKGLDSMENSILNAGLITEFKVGDLEIQPNREGLHYDKKTIAAIKAKIQSIIPEVKPMVLANFQNKNKYEQMALSYSIFNYNGGLSSISEIVRSMLKDLKIPQYVEFKGLTLTGFTKDSWRSRVRKNEMGQDYKLTYQESREFIFEDKKSHKALKAKKYLNSDDRRYSQLVFVREEVPGALDDLKKEYGLDIKACRKSSELPFDGYAKTGGAGGVQKVMQYQYGYTNKDCWVEGQIDPSAKQVIYVIRKGYSIEGVCDSIRYFNNEIERLNKLTGDDHVVYGLTTRQLKDKPANWIHFNDALDAAKKEQAEKQKEKIAVYNYRQKHYSDFPVDVLKAIKADEKTVAGQALEEYLEIEKELKNFDSSLVTLTKDISDKYKLSTHAVMEQYPIINIISHWETAKHKNGWAELRAYFNAKG